MIKSTTIWLIRIWSSVTGGPTLQQVEAMVDVCDIQHKEVVVAQAMAETGWLKCSNCSMDYNNLFGFRTTAYMKFDHWTTSVLYYEKWQNKRYKTNGDRQDYISFLKKIGYSTSSTYGEFIQKIIKKIESTKQRSSSKKVSSIHRLPRKRTTENRYDQKVQFSF